MTASFKKAASIAARKEIAQAMEEMRVQFEQMDARIRALEAPKRLGRPPKIK